MDSIENLGNGLGFLYITKEDGTSILNNIPNNSAGVNVVRTSALTAAALTGEVLAHAEVTLTAAAAGNITSLAVNGVNQLSGNVATTAGDLAATAISVRNSINNFTPATGPNFYAQANGAVIILIAPPGTGADANGYVVSFAAGSGITATHTDVYGGSGANDNTNGKRYWINTTGVSGDLSGAVEISDYLIMRGLQSKLDEQSVEISNGVITLSRQGAITTLSVDTEGSASTDNLVTIAATNFVFGDILIIRGADASDIVTLVQSGGAGENIYLQDDTSFDTGDTNNIIALQYINDDGTAKWVEMWRVPNLSSTVSVAALRAALIPEPASGTTTTALTIGGGTISLTPGSSKGYQIITGNVTLSSSWTIQGAGSPLDGDHFVVDYRGTNIIGGNTITIFGISLTAAQALAGDVQIFATYNLANTTWKARLLVDLSSAGSIESTMIKNKAIISALYGDASIPATAYANSTIPSSALDFSITNNLDVIVIPVSFEATETGAITWRANFNGTISRMDIVASRILAGTDAGTVQVQTPAGLIPEVLSLPASSAVGATTFQVPSVANTFTTGQLVTFTMAKTTPGGRAIVELAVTKTA